MTENIRESWRTFKESEPGNRFQNLHRQRREAGDLGLWRILTVVIGTGLILVAVLC